VREVAIRERPMNQFNTSRGRGVEREGRQLVAYRPQLPQTPPTVRTAPNTGRGQGNGTTMGRPTSGSGSVTTTTPRSQTGVGNRGNAEAGRGAPRTATESSTPNVGRQPNVPRNNERITTLTPTQGQPPTTAPRRDGSLFGNSGTERGRAGNQTPAVQAPLRSEPRTPPSAAVTPRTAPTVGAISRQVTPRTEQRENAVPTRVAPNNIYQSPRQYEQAPRRVETAPSAGPAPQSRSSSGQERSVPSGGSHGGSSGGGRGERGERSR